MSKERIEWVDIYKALMIIYIVAGHTISPGPLKTYVYSFHVAAFFFISGYMYETGPMGFQSFILRKIRSLMIPYYSFAIISVIVFFLVGKFTSVASNSVVNPLDFVGNIKVMLWANTATGTMAWNMPLWFLPCLFAVECITYPLMKTIHSNCTILLYALISLGLALANYYIFKIGGLPFQLETGLYMMPLWFAGIFCHSKDIIKKFEKKLIAGIVVVFIGCILSLFSEQRVDYAASNFGNLFCYYPVAILSTFGYVILVKFINWDALKYIGKNTLSILVMHKYPVEFQKLILEKVCHNSVVYQVGSIGVVITSIILCLIAGKIIDAIIPFLFGKPYRKR